jgi:ubiquitin carboxyl-terminal hydrolase 9/24
MNIDCQIRGKSDIHEALATMCEVEYMEGDNKVFCDNCKRNCDTVLRTAISALPDMLILSLKRFDLDYNTFETVKLNSRCEFGQTLNMKRYTLEGVEAMEKANESTDTSDSTVDPLSALPNEDYEYRLAGVLVHHGVAQGGHYYSFIRDRTEISDNSNEWFRFDDEDVTPFDPSNIETECFGGKVKKETKWPNGQVNSVETEQLANALMVFYEKVKPMKLSEECPKDEEMVDANGSKSNDLVMVTGTSEFNADVNRSNTLHQTHSFLFDKEFQGFMKQMLNLVVLDLSSDRDEKMTASTPAQCQIAILNVCICFYFDVLLHYIEKDALDDWSTSLYQAFYISTEASIGFISELADRTHCVAANWLQTYATDCPDKNSREAAMAIIATAMGSILHSEQELHLLSVWTQDWATQIEAWEKTPRLQTPLPVSLGNENTSPSNLGKVVTFICALLEYSPRTWRYLPELCSLLKNLGSIPSSTGGDFMRNALLAAQIPARLICTILREKAHPILRAAMPGSSLSAEVVEQTSKVESAPSSHLLPLNSNSVAMGSGLAPGPTSGCPSPADHWKAVEALATIIGVQGTSSIPLVTEATTSRVKNRPVAELSNQGTQALTTMFNEYASQPGTMRQKDLLQYMRVCSASENVQQRVANLLNKYTKDPNCLPLDGFLDYYRDASQSNELEVGLI